MIAPQELRLGNKILRNGIVVTVDNQTFWDIEKYPEQYEPIELTEDWLMKFGFKKHEVTPFYYLEVCNDWTRIYFNPVHKVCELSISGHSAVLKHIEYVHQMQNLKFEVTGEELTIKES